MKKLFFASLLAISVVSCSTMSVNSAKIGTHQASLNNTKWELVDSNSKGTIPTLTITDGKINGSAPCNKYFGEVALNEASGSIDVKNVGSTRMMCNAIVSETAYLKLLDEVNSYVVTGNTLELYKDGLLLLKFNKIQ